MKVADLKLLAAIPLLAAFLLVPVFPGYCQEQAYEFGRIVSVDEEGEALKFLEEEKTEAEKRLPWIPVLSPCMICLDCWITKTVDIHQFYSQQAAERYFAKAETCADLQLSHDPCIGTGLKYTLLAPFYAGCPDLLYNGGFWGWMRMRCGGWFGMGGGYGLQSPMPSPAIAGPGGTQLMSPATSAPPALAPAAQPGAAGMQLMPQGGTGSGSAQAAPAEAVSVQTANAGASRWAQMSDAEILAYFGLGTASGAVVGQKLSEPVANAPAWEFADESVSTPAVEMLAAAQLPAQEAVKSAPATEMDAQPKRAEADSSDADVEDLLKESQASPKSFSVTDKEYDKMRDIEKSMLEGL